MPLLDLSAEEQAFLATPLPVLDARSARAGSAGFALHLGRQIARTLRARLREPLQLVPADWAAGPVNRPHWQVGRELAGIWLSRRLGGAGSGTGLGCMLSNDEYVPPALLRTLDAVLAECWLDTPVELPAALAWRLPESCSHPVLALALPASKAEMQRWTREVIAS